MDPQKDSQDVTSSESMDHTVVNSESTSPYLGCALHRQKRCAMYCKDCDLLICHTCLASERHVGHRFLEIPDILNEKKKLLKEKQIELKKTICSTYQDIAADVQNGISKTEKEYEDLSAAIALQEDNLHKEIDKLFNKSKAISNEMKNKQLNNLQNHLEDINRKLIEIDDEIDSIDKALGSNDISTILQVLHSSKVDQHKRLPSKLVPSAPKFTPGKIQVEKLLKFVGTLSAFNITTEKHGYSIKAAHDPLEFGYFSPRTSESTEIYSPNTVSMESPGAGSSLQVSKKLPSDARSSPHVPKNFPADEYPPADEQQSPVLGSTTFPYPKCASHEKKTM